MAFELAVVEKVEITADQFNSIQRFLETTSGIVLGDSKQYLVKNRLSDLVLKGGLNSFAALAATLQSDSFAAKKIKTAVIDAMTTNETFWFRDELQFAELKEKILPELLRSRCMVRIWSAACSTGQEPYTISICAENIAGPGNAGGIQVVGTDISGTVLAEAKNAVYSERVLARGLGSAAKANYFQPVAGGYQLRSEITRRVKFLQVNLLDSFTGLGRFDIIFCRNVLIYFSQEMKRDILQRMSEVLTDGGYLFLSSTESMSGDIKQYEPIRGGRARYFRKVT